MLLGGIHVVKGGVGSVEKGLRPRLEDVKLNAS